MQHQIYKLFSIGFVINAIHDLEFAAWDQVASIIEVLPEYAAGLKGLEDFSHVIVVFRLSQAGFDPDRDIVKRPFELSRYPLAGVFARRAKDRPNQLGVSTVRILSVEPARLTVKGLDAMDGTPVLDLKAYDPEYDAVERPLTPDWVGSGIKTACIRGLDPVS